QARDDAPGGTIEGANHRDLLRREAQREARPQAVRVAEVTAVAARSRLPNGDREPEKRGGFAVGKGQGVPSGWHTLRLAITRLTCCLLRHARSRVCHAAEGRGGP